MLRLLHIVLFLAGAFNIYIGAFTYNKGARLGNKLDDFWDRSIHEPNDLESLGRAFLIRVGGKVKCWLIPVFMEEVFSARWIMLCATLPLVSCFWTILTFALLAQWNHPADLIRAAENSDARDFAWMVLWLLPIAFAVSYFSELFLALVRFIGVGLVGVPVFVARGVSSLVKGDFDFPFRAPRIAGVWNSIRDYPQSWHLPVGLKAWVLTLHKIFVGLMLAYTTVCMALCIPIFILAIAALTIPLIAVWFGWLGMLAIRAISVDLARLPRYEIAMIIAAGVLPSAACLFTTRWILSRWFRDTPSIRRRLITLNLALLVSSSLCIVPLLVFRHVHPATANGRLLADVSIFVALCNAINVLVASLLVGFALLLVVHRRIWRRLRHWLMALRLAGVSFSRKFYLSAGILLVLVSGGNMGEWWNLFTSNPRLFEKLQNVFERVVGWF